MYNTIGSSFNLVTVYSASIVLYDELHVYIYIYTCIALLGLHLI